ncbi:hypothetical protein [Streptomyces sp. DSM 40907]|uniref:hypothetical protein n=1 Tax=Streptomyces kutzneri TaxID=3051179 RepID=UPI0028D6F46A|nr:hypothetical protein [Streptomyces sp. DSM 40907]
MTISEDVSREAGEQFSFARRFIHDDVQQQRLHYHLLRLTVVGLAQEEVEELRELGRLAFEDADVREQSTKIKQRAGASALAVALADIVERAEPGAPRPQAMVGAVLGAYAGLHSVPGMDESTVAVLGAIGGAISATISPIVFESIEVVGLESYLSAAH